MPTFLYHMKDHSSSFSDQKNNWWGANPSTWNFGPNWPCWSENADFQSIFSRSASAVTQRKKFTNMQCTTSFPISLKMNCTMPLSPQRGLKTQCPKFEQLSARTSKRYKIECHHPIVSRIRAFDCCRHRWPWMTLNEVMALILRYFTEFDTFAGRLRHSGWI